MSVDQVSSFPSYASLSQLPLFPSSLEVRLTVVVQGTLRLALSSSHTGTHLLRACAECVEGGTDDGVSALASVFKSFAVFRQHDCVASPVQQYD